MSKWLRLAAVPVVAGAVIVLTTASVWAFTQETLNPNGNYNFNYGPLDGKAKSDDSTNKSDPNDPGFHFSVDGGQHTSPFGLRSFGNDRTPDTGNYFHEPLGNGN